MTPTEKIIHLAKRCGPIFRLADTLSFRYKTLRDRRHNRLRNKAYGWITRDIIGRGNHVELRAGSLFKGLRIGIRGNNNRIIVESGCYIGPGCLIWAEGDDNTIVIGRGVSMTGQCQINAQEKSTTIRIGDDCMLANNIHIRTSDAHKIVDAATGRRLNPAADVNIGSHVWIAPNTKILKGAAIADGCIVGSDSTVTGVFPDANCLIVGRPARAVRTGITWNRDNVLKIFD